MEMNISECEKIVIGILISDTEMVKHCTLRPNELEKEENRIILETVYDMYDRNLSTQADVVAAELENKGKLGEIGGTSYLASCATSSPSDDIKTLDTAVNMVREKHREKRFMEIIEETKQNSKMTSVDELLNEHFEECRELIDRRTEQKEYSFDTDESAEEFVKNAKKYSENEGQLPPNSISLGDEKLDIMCNGIGRSEYILVTGDAKAGKTSFTLDRTLAMTDINDRDQGIYFESLEMPRYQVVSRLMCNLSNVSYNKVMWGSTTKKEQKRLERAKKELNSRNIKICHPTGDNTIQDFFVRVRRMADAHDIDIAILDYLHLLDKFDSDFNREEHISYMSKRIQKFSRTEQIPIMAVAKTNYDSEIFGSKSVSYDINTEIKILNAGDDTSKKRKISIPRVRGAAGGTKWAEFNGPTYSFSNIRDHE